MNTEAPKIVGPGDVARMFRVDPKTVTRWANEGKIKSFRTLGGHRRFYLEDLLKQIAQGKEDDE